MAHGIGATRGINHLLDAVSPDETPRSTGSFSPVYLPVNTILAEPTCPLDAVYFPLNAVISVVTRLDERTTVEVATVGSEGMIGVPLEPGGALGFRAVSQMAGWAIRMDTACFLDEVARPGPLSELVTDYVAMLLAQVAQSAACNLRHSNQQRLSRWLLTSHDRAGRDVLDITRESLAARLGLPPLTVALSVAILEAGGSIRYRHDELRVRDRAGLERSSCECYGVMRRQLERVAQAQRERQHTSGRVLSGHASGARRFDAPAPA